MELGPQHRHRHRIRLGIRLLIIGLAIPLLAAVGNAKGEVPPGAEGKAVEFPLPEESMAEDLTLGPDGALWFTLDRYLKPGEIGRSGVGGEIKLFPVPSMVAAGQTKESLTGITTGADGRLWFGSANGAGAAVGSISTAGEVDLVPLAHPRRNPTSIAAGAGGGVWFTTTNGSDRTWIGEIGPGGAVHEFRVPGKVGAEGIVAGPGDDMWFLASTPANPWPPGGVLGRITTDGKASLFPIPGAEGAPDGIAASGGRIWFGAELDEPVIASADRRGRIRELPLPSPRGESGYVNSIAPASNGGVWFVGNDPPILGQVGRGGEVRRTLLAAEAGSYRGLTTDGEGNLWAARIGSRSSGLLRIRPRIPGSQVRQLGALGRQGPVRVKVDCARGPDPCHGTLRLSHERTGETCCGPINLAFTRYRVPANGTKVVAIEVSATARVELTRAARHGHLVTVGGFEPGGFAADRPLRVAGVDRR